MQTPNQIFHTRLNLALNRHNSTLKSVAQVSGYSYDYIRRVRQNPIPNPGLTFIWAMARTLKVSPAWLAGFE